MTREEALIELHHHVAYAEQVDSDYVGESTLKVDVLRVAIAALTPPSLPLPDAEGWWWEWNSVAWVVTYIEWGDYEGDESELGYWDRDGTWRCPNRGHWIPCLPPPELEPKEKP